MKYKFVSGHFMLEFEEKWFMLDTGSPKSIGKGKININGRFWSLTEEIGGMNLNDFLNKAIEFVGETFSGFIGNDIISNYDVIVNGKNNTIEFFEETKQHNGVKLNFDFIGQTNSPRIKLGINGKEVKAVLDTGARLSFAEKSFFNNKVKTRSEKEFNPMFGDFMTDIYTLDVNIAGIKETLDFGTLLDNAEPFFQMIGVSAFVGSQFFINKVIVISFRQKAIWVMI